MTQSFNTGNNNNNPVVMTIPLPNSQLSPTIGDQLVKLLKNKNDLFN